MSFTELQRQREILVKWNDTLDGKVIVERRVYTDGTRKQVVEAEQPYPELDSDVPDTLTLLNSLIGSIVLLW